TGGSVTGGSGSGGALRGNVVAGAVTLTGHGFGPGYGMGQWGAFGYAIKQLSYQQILAHYYSNTAISTVGNPAIRVLITENSGNDVIVTSPSAFTAAGLPVPAGGAALMHDVGSGRFSVYIGASCSGPWPAAPATTVSEMAAGASAAGAVAAAVPSGHGPGAPASQLLQLCQGGGNKTLRGDIAAYDAGGSARTINVVPLDSYVQGVVPSEMPAYWGGLGASGPQGQAWGFQALEAQAVAARTYAEALMAENGGQGAYVYADICDTPMCQDYRGVVAETTLSNLAVADTSGQALTRAGAPAFTQYSASTGGYTAGGVFNAVPDAGDAVCVPSACNPNHDWTVKVSASSIQAAFPSIGSLESVNVVSRNGLGSLGGRAGSVDLVGSAGTKVVTGSSLAWDLGLQSNWFAVQGAPSGGVGGYWLSGSAGGIHPFGAASTYGSMAGRPLDKPIVGMAATPSGTGYWLVASDGGIFAFGDAGFHGSMGGRPLNKPIVGMAATPSGRGYWLVASDGGVFAFGDAGFHGSMGGRPLNKPIVGMAATPSGKGYWLVASDGGIFAFGDAAFHGSTGGASISAPAVGMASTATGAGYWIVGQDGWVSAFGDAPSLGPPPTMAPGEAAAGLMATKVGLGYAMFTTKGALDSFGNAPAMSSSRVVIPGYAGTIVGGAASGP
ncbi:MAG: SpoIID/LytB domain-containing protein, partial [Acidimicrobiales bacterium]